MAYPNVLDDELAEVGPASKPRAGRITPGFNAALIAFHAVAGFLAFVGSGRAGEFPLRGLFLSSLIDLVRFVVVMLACALFLRAFWGRLVASLAPVRPIDFSEALAIVLMASLLLGR